jgi:molybdopterin/thiamine biosynthesis adenylyltransferase
MYMNQLSGYDVIGVLHMDKFQKEFFDRQTKLPGIGLEGQKELLNSHVLVIGAGGLGCSVIDSLARCGIGELTIVDFDKVDCSNLHRQTLFNQKDIGEFKAFVAAEKIKDIVPWIKVNTFTERFSANNVEKFYNDQNVIVDCTDNLQTKFFIHDFAFRKKRDLVTASIHKFDGQLQCFQFSKTQDSGCMRCLWNEEPNQLGSCEDNGVLGVVPGIFGALQANEVIKVLLNKSELQNSELVTMDLMSLEVNMLKYKKNNECLLCNKNTKFQVSEDVVVLEELIDLNDYISIDIRGKSQQEILSKITLEENYLLICDRGVRAQSMAKDLRKQGLNNVFSLFPNSSSAR